jgi:hypothetical protein
MRFREVTHITRTWQVIRIHVGPSSLVRPPRRHPPWCCYVLAFVGSDCACAIQPDDLSSDPKPADPPIDNLFILAQLEINFKDRCYDELLTQPLPSELEVMFGEASVSHGWSSYYFVEAPKGYDGPCRYFQLYLHPTGYVNRRYKVASSRNEGGQICFVTWLQRRLERWRVA